jgi:uncharacterized SAM-binding protein YcdF (DUF218 family)
VVDAVICLSGDGLVRVRPAVEIARSQGCVLVLAGSRSDHAAFDSPRAHWELLEHTRALSAEKVVCLDALNTWEQAVNTVALARARGWQAITIVASGHHITRAYLTFVKALGGRYDIALWPCSVPSERMGTDEFRAKEEAKIAVYTGIGNCANAEELADYVRTAMP